jgi:CheY-like chemotaxis protein
MPGGGKLTIRTSVADADQGAGRAIGASVCIAISDTGGGIDEDLRERIFEPFFTTKGVGEGTGLGLAIVYGIVKEHNGAIDVQSVPNQGTTFRIFLPIPDFGSISVSLDSSHRQSSTPPPPRRGGTVLVVEDERSLIRLLDTLLPQAGYRVLAATDGEQAIELYQRHKAVIDVVLLDLGLPKITGLDVIPKLKEQNSNVSIVIATGYLEPRLKEELMRVGVKDCISKPYAVKDVIERLDSVIQTCRTAVPPVA